MPFLASSFNYHNEPVKVNSDSNYKDALAAAKATMKLDNPYIIGVATPEEGESAAKDWGTSAAQRITMLKNGKQHTGHNNHSHIYQA